MVFRIAHQVDVNGLILHAPEIIGRSASSPKMRMALYRILPFTPFPAARAGSCVVSRRAMPHHEPVFAR